MSDLEGKQTDEEKLFAVRTENKVLMDKISLLEYQIEYIKKQKRSGKIRIIIDQLSDDLKFMKEAGDLFSGSVIRLQLVSGAFGHGANLIGGVGILLFCTDLQISLTINLHISHCCCDICYAHIG